jgi:hypothetical protein
MISGSLGAAGLATMAAGVLQASPVVCAGAVALLVAAWYVRPDPDPARWLRGAAAERATADLLSRLSRRRWAVFHDLGIPGSRANVDHLVIGPTGVWVIDTKSRGSRARPIDTAAVSWEAEKVSGLLDVEAIPLVVVHGGHLRRRGSVVEGVRVLPVRRMLKHLRRAPRVLSRTELWHFASQVPDAFNF